MVGKLVEKLAFTGVNQARQKQLKSGKAILSRWQLLVSTVEPTY